jgi:LPS export ABC transporter protein LptC
MNTPFFLQFFLVFLGSCLLISCTKSTDYATEFGTNQALVDSLSNHSSSTVFTMNIVQNGIIKMQISGSRADHYTSKALNQTIMSGPIYFTVYSSEGDTSVVGLSDEAIYFGDESRFKMIGNVFLTAEGNRKLQTQDTLVWDQQKDRISSNDFLIIVTPEDSISGYGLDGNTQLTEYEFKKISGKTTFSKN